MYRLIYAGREDSGFCYPQDCATKTELDETIAFYEQKHNDKPPSMSGENYRYWEYGRRKFHLIWTEIEPIQPFTITLSNTVYAFDQLHSGKYSKYGVLKRKDGGLPNVKCFISFHDHIVFETFSASYQPSRELVLKKGDAGYDEIFSLLSKNAQE